MDKIFLKKKIQLSLEKVLNFFMSIMPKNKSVVFSSTRGYEGSPKYLYFYLRNKKTKFDVYWITADKDFYNRNKNDKRLIYSYSLKGIITFSRAAIYVSGNSIKVYGKIYSILKGRILIQTGHGIPIKTVGIKAKKFYSAWDIQRQCQLGYNSLNTFVVVSGPYEKKAIKECFGVPEKNFLKVGQPRNSIFNISINEIEGIKRKILINELDKKIALYAPTWRGYDGFELFPFLDLDIEKLNEFLKEKNIILIIKMHPFERCDLSIIKNKSNIIEFSSKWEIDNQEIQLITDILITDYSSIYCDYINMLKPIMFIHNDIEDYIEKRGLLSMSKDIFPGPVVLSQFQFINEMNKLLENNSYYLKERKHANYMFNKYEEYNSLDKIEKFIDNFLEKY